MNHYEVMETWVTQARAGDPAAKLRLLTAYRPLILSMVSKYVYDQALGEDSVEDGCLIFREAVEAYKTGAGVYFQTYVKKRLFYAFVQRAKPERQISAQAELYLEIPAGEGGTLMDTLIDPGGDAGARVLRQEDSARLRAALETLTDDQRRVIDDYYVKGLDWAEIAARQQVKLGTVCSRMNRALKRLQEAFEVEDT